MNTDKIREILDELYSNAYYEGPVLSEGPDWRAKHVDKALDALTSELEKDAPDATEPLKMYRPKDELLGEGCDLTNRESVLCYVADLLDNMVEDSGSFQLARKYCEYIAELEKSAPRWVSVEERLPEEDGWYLVFDTGAGEVTEGRYHFGCGWYQADGDLFPPYTIEHWQPLPTLPAKKEDK